MSEQCGEGYGSLEETLERIKKNENDLKSMFPEYEELLRFAAAVMDDFTIIKKEAEKWEEEYKSNELLRGLSNLPKASKSRGKSCNPDALKWMISGAHCMALETHIALTKTLSSCAALKAANAKHSRSGGSRELADKMRKTWASGKYSSRDICAEQECAALNMSFSTARKALRNTPDPT